MVNRIDPKLPVGAMRTYGFSSPPATHRRAATCAEIDCPNRARGWVTRLHIHDDAALTLLRNAVKALRLRCQVARDGDFWAFTFEAGQDCFNRARHTVALEREAVYYVRGGDWRGTTDRARVLAPGDWLDDFAGHQDRLADRIGRG